MKEAFKSFDVVNELVAHDRYYLVVNDEIILPSCWDYLVEPGWSVKMFKRSIPEHFPIPLTPPLGEQNEGVFEAQEVQNSVEDPAPPEGNFIPFSGFPSEAPDRSTDHAHRLEESSMTLDILESGNLVSDLHSASDAESTSPKLRLRGGGLPDKAPRARPAYVEDVDEAEGHAIRGTRRWASSKGKNAITPQDRYSYTSDGFTGGEPSQQGTIATKDRSLQGSEVSEAPFDEGWEARFSGELAPSDSASVVVRPLPSLRSRRDRGKAIRVYPVSHSSTRGVLVHKNHGV
jgi:hypothetical protein